MYKALPLLLVLFFGNAFCQNKKICGTFEALQSQIAADPSVLTTFNKINQNAVNYANHNIANKQPSEIYTIPVVVHVIESEGYPETNISDEQVYSQIDALNRDFRKLNLDEINNNPNEFKAIAADIEVEFCLAQHSPNGQASTGITHTLSPLSQFSVNLNEAKYDSLGGKNIWNAEQYLNIWVVRKIIDTSDTNIEILGYAQFPGLLPNTDGVVIAYYAFGTNGAIEPDYNLGRTAVHEVGHWLNLRHTWGDDLGSCFGDDDISDTPRTADANFGCPDVTTNTCLEQPTDYNDMIQNYMDYTNQACANMFTYGQKQRMRLQLSQNGERYQITQSDACTPALENNVSLIDIVKPFGTNNCTTIQPIILFKNNGSTNLNSLQINYNIDNGTDSVLLWQPNTPLAPQQETQITLSYYTVINSGLIHNLKVKLIAPNGFADADPSNNELIQSFATISLGASLPFTESFENNFPPNTQWTINNLNNNNTFEQNTNCANTGSKCLFINNFQNNIPNQIDEIILPDLDLANNNALLTFYVAYAQINPNASDTLIVSVSTNCGNNYLPIYKQYGTNLASVTPINTNFIPQINQFKKEILNLNPFINYRNLRIKFTHISGQGNNLYLDDIQVNAEALGVNSPNLIDYKIENIFPNPATCCINITLSSPATTQLLLSLFDVLENKISTQPYNIHKGTNNLTIDTQHLINGTYFVHLQNQNILLSKKIIILK